MQYRTTDRLGEPLPALGMGCMRLPRRHGAIDMEQTQRLIDRAIERGITYFDTAYIYSGSEEALGRALETNGRREQIAIASKLPHYLLKKREDAPRIFRQQLQRLRTDTIDYYLMHMLPDCATWDKLIALGVRDWLEEQKRRGSIRKIGFSYHGHTEEFLHLLHAYDWDFCQVQYNYMDENAQAGRRGVQAAHEKGIPVFIMEPLRGGRLAEGLPPAAKKIFARQAPERSPAQWGLGWLWDQPEVTCVLSGMSDLAMLEENCSLASECTPGWLPPQARKAIQEARAAINEKIRVGCTACGYCKPCPAGVDIPGVFRCYNERYTDGWFTAEKEYMMCSVLRKKPTYASLCRGCGLCESHCPQGISIRQELKKATRVLENPAFRVARGAVHLTGRFR